MPVLSSSSSSSSCQSQIHSKKMFLAQKTSPFFLHKFHPKTATKFRYIPKKFTVSASLNAIAAAAASGSGATVHGAVSSAITQVAVTAFAIASGACLSTKVEFLWPKVEEQPGSFTVEGIDVTGYPIFNEAKAVDTVVAGILHDVIDDACESLLSIEAEFGDDVAKLVAGVSRLSYINQLLRRHRRINVNQGTLSHEEANNLRVMLLGMVDDPRVVLIKLADRLHNMRTIEITAVPAGVVILYSYALPLAKAQAVAQETLLVWCSLASRLGLWAVKAEMEDLCFAVLQPQIFRKLRADLASMWSTSNRGAYPRRISAKAGWSTIEENDSAHDGETFINNEDITSIKDLLEAVVPFDILLDRRKRTNFLNKLGESSETEPKPKVVQDAGIALASLVVCEEALEKELFISISYVPGMEVTLSSRLKSLYSIYSKMKRKDVGINKIYDARALRVVVGDKNGTLHGSAVQCCYNLLNIVHRLWTPIDGEFDDYIVNPKPSGYQSLHTAVQGPDASPLEVQIRTQRMHEYAEHGLAAHWLYKETGNDLPSEISLDESEIEESSYYSKDLDDQNSLDDESFQKYRSLKVGHPVLRVEGSNLLAAVIIRVDKEGKELLVAVSFGLAASEAVADRRSSFQIKRWEAYARLFKKVSDEWWCEPGHGDWCTCLERYTLCRDGIYHKQDQFERLLPTFIQVIDLTEQEESEYWAVMSAVFEGKPVESIATTPSLTYVASNSIEASINRKVRLLRTMLQWEEQLRSESSFGREDGGAKSSINPDSVVLGEVVIICWPHGDIMRLRSGSTAADAARRAGLDGKLVVVNGQLVLPNTELKDGDVVEGIQLQRDGQREREPTKINRGSEVEEWGWKKKPNDGKIDEEKQRWEMGKVLKNAFIWQLELQTVGCYERSVVVALFNIEFSIFLNFMIWSRARHDA
ncbi:GTP-binding protein-related protein [Corchorus capsularis]|uniref:GTP-binding protein-related protein n=1 Tax=Corchorus capsularis TaxID=210143 RepID=A0A1R3K5N1_COCAP|nr:GTP-binding protein-related protein [Corchorus capsularis]